jgi:serine/threonine protein kinase
MDPSVPFCPNCTGLYALSPTAGGGLRCPNCHGDFRPEVIAPTGQWSHAPAEVDTSNWPFSAEFLTRYKPVRFLGRGAMGAVYLMRQALLDRLVAVKVVRDGPLTREETDRLQREARILARLQHPAILMIHDVAFDYALPCMISEYVDGETLGTRLRRDPPLPLPGALDLMVEVLEGLAVAHQAGIIHRDLKPDNIFLTSAGRPKIGDFGLARAENAHTGSSVGMVVGTPQYMSPEQCCGERAVPASDLYSVGVMLYAMTTGQLPFPGPDLPSYLYQHMRQTPVSPAALNPWLPEPLVKIIQKSLAKDPRARYGDARELAQALQASKTGLNPQDRARMVASNPPPPAIPSGERANVVSLGALRSIPSGPRPALKLAEIPTDIRMPWETPSSVRVLTPAPPVARPTRSLSPLLLILAALAYANFPQVRHITHAAVWRVASFASGPGKKGCPEGQSGTQARACWNQPSAALKTQYGKMGCRLEQEGRLQEALQYYQMAWQIDPNCRPLNERIAFVQSKLRR